MLRTLALTLACAASLLAGPAAAQGGYPNHPIKLIVGFPPGGSTDLAGRVLAAKLTQGLGQVVVVENKAGASGNIAADAVARSAPDGYTLLMAAVTSEGVPAKNIRELVAYSKAHPGQLNLASPGATTLTRLSGEMFKQVAGLEWVTVNYKGGAPAMQDMLAGRAHVMFANISDVIAQVRAGKLNPIAVTTPKRTAVMPDVPTLAESGYPDFAFATWQAVVGPAGLPKEVVDKLNAAIREAMATPEVQSQFLGFGTDAATSSPEELGRLLDSEVAKIKRIAQSVDTTK